MVSCSSLIIVKTKMWHCAWSLFVTIICEVGNSAKWTMICLALRTDASCRPEATPTESTNTPRFPSRPNSAWMPSPLPTWLHPKTLRGPPSPYLPHLRSSDPPSWCDSRSWIPKRWSATWTSSSTAPRSRRTRILRAFGCSNCRPVGRRRLPLHSLSWPLPLHRMRIWRLSRITCCGLSTRIFHPARRRGFNWLKIYRSIESKCQCSSIFLRRITVFTWPW